jgi:DNA-directed RNA polymerase specialized sigma24 family protein
VLWKFFGGLSDEEIGRQLDIQPGHVRVLRHRGLDRLRADAVLKHSLSGDSPALRAEGL